MTPAGRIDVQAWMRTPEIGAVLAALGADGAAVRFVGGCVRDAVLGRSVRDIDIATPDTPETVMRLLGAAGIKVVPTGIDHGTVTAVTGGAHFEITSLRRDVETYGRHARVAYTDDWAEDAARRDFTMNALFCDVDGTLYDPCGGLADARAGRVRFVGDAAARIEEDVLRLLRFFRFQAHYGRRPPDRDALAACRALAWRLPELSGERLRAELLRLLEARHAVEVLELMRDEDILSHVLPEAGNFQALGRLIHLEAETDGKDALRRLAVLLNCSGPGARQVCARLRLSAAECRRLVGLVAPPIAVAVGDDATAQRRALHRLGAVAYMDLVLVAWARDDHISHAAAYQIMLDAAARWTPKTLPITGADVTAAGVPVGPEVGRILDHIEEWWIDGEFRADRSQALARIREQLRARRGRAPRGR